MKFIRTGCNEDRIKRGGQHAFDTAKTAVMTDSTLRHEFMSLCNNNHDMGKEVYTAVLQKAIHARFAVVYRQWKETNVDAITHPRHVLYFVGLYDNDFGRNPCQAL
jgi:hypothetical protein